MKRKTEKEKMSECHLCLLGLIALSSLLTGASVVNETHVFINSGENVRLPCNNALPDCNSTTWNYNKDSTAVELINLGKKKKDTERRKRLSLKSNCSLKIKNISTEDYGSYSCRQYVNGQQGTDARVYLHVLHVSQTEISAGLSVTLFCQLYSYPRVSCDDSVSSERIQLFWVNQAGVKLTTDSRYQISSSSDHCNISLNTILLNEDQNREWRCEVTQNNQLKTSVTYTVKSSVPVISSVIVISAAAASAVFLAAVLWLICRKRAGNKRETDESVVKDENEDKVTYETINMSTPAAARDNEQTDDVTYSEVSCSSKKPVKSLKDQDDSVTYAAIRGTENELLGELYASVNKNKSCTNPDS